MNPDNKFGYSITLPPKVFKILRDAVAAEIRKDENYILPFISLEGMDDCPGRLMVVAGAVLPGLGLIDELAKQLGEEQIPLTKNA